jgi:uncharacterized protein (DUF2249 family)
MNKNLIYWRSLLITSVFCALQIDVFAQTLKFAKGIGNIQFEIASDIAIDAAGNSYTTGYFVGTVDFDPGPSVYNLSSTTSGQQAFILKLDKTGNFVWAKQLDGTAANFGNSIETDNAGDVYYCGSFEGTCDFDPNAGSLNLTSNGGQDIFVSKLDALGNLVWVKQIGGPVYLDIAVSMTLDALGNIYATGLFQDTVDFDPGIGVFNLNSVCINLFALKLDGAGNFVWAKQTEGTTCLNTSFGIGVDNGGNVCVVGKFEGTADFDPSAANYNLMSNGMVDVFVWKLDAAGNFLWAREFGGTNSDEANAVAIDGSDNIYVTGYFSGTVDFDPSAAIYNLSAVNSTAFISKFDQSGNFLWAKELAGIGSSSIGQAIAIDAFNNVYATGNFGGTIDFDPNAGVSNQTAIGGGDIFISKLDQSGNFLSSYLFGGTANENGTSIGIYNSDIIYLTGTFQGPCDFDPTAATSTLPNAGDYDFFVLKLAQCNNIFDTIAATSCGSYLSPSGHHVWSTTGVYSDTISGTNGCDSILSISLVINTPADTTVTVSSTSLTANLVNATYQWLDCDNLLSPVSGANNQNFAPLVSGNYAVEIQTIDGCKDTSSCFQVLLTNIDDEVKNVGNRPLVGPNPCSGPLDIDLTYQSEISKVTIRSILGVEICSSTFFKTQKCSIALPQNSPLYFVEITNDRNEVYSFKVMKQ